MANNTQTTKKNVSCFTVPGMEYAPANNVIELLDNRLVSLLDLALTLKQVHWNIVAQILLACTRCLTRR